MLPRDRGDWRHPPHRCLALAEMAGRRPDAPTVAALDAVGPVCRLGGPVPPVDSASGADVEIAGLAALGICRDLSRRVRLAPHEALGPPGRVVVAGLERGDGGGWRGPADPRP